VLSRYTGEEDVVFGAVRACRYVPIDGANSIVGLFINTVPVRVRLTPGTELRAWLRELREQWIAFREYEHTPLMQAQQYSDVPAGRPLFETLFNYQEPSWDAALRQLGGRWEHRHFEIRSQPNYPLAVDVYGGGATIVKMFYDRRRFADHDVARLLGHYRTVLEALASGTATTLAEIPLLTAREREQLLVGWNRTAADFPGDLTVQRLFEERAADAPDRMAVADTAVRLTYGELNRRANRLAHRLRAHGIGPGGFVALCMDRSAEMMVAWLGVLKAGGAFVPLDPAAPRERLAVQLDDCDATVWLTQPRLHPLLPEPPAGVVVLEITSDGTGLEAEPEVNPAPDATPGDLAYVIYTSGSTGRPKGVQIEHRSLMNLVTWHNRTYAITSSDRAAQVASPAFDASVWEVWPYLCAGAGVYIPDEDTRLSPPLLWRWMAAHAITVAFVPTPIAELLMDEPRLSGMVLRALLTGGDKLKRRPPASFACRVVNHYGPTENTVVATCAAVAAEPASGVPVIGRPVANTRAYVLDALLRPVPVGVPGELYLAGDSLARGYLRRPELTAEKFIPDPFCQTALSRAGDRAPPRLYRTGDRVRWTSAGELEFLGRLDGQVKVRGCRIEPGEIEATLLRHTAVREALVVALPSGQGAADLVAYIVPGSSVTPAELGGFLRAKLPSYMVPAAFVVLPAWPLTPNGKIDREALPPPAEWSAGPASREKVALNPTEQTIAQIWSEILGRREIGPHVNFFELGGHSLFAARVVSRLNHALEAGFSVRALFDHPTVAELARLVDSRPAAALAAPVRRLRRRSARAEAHLLQPSSA
jgi:amino acid adenylation domain-containing protein